MKILLVGSGGREHAIAVKLAQSPLTEKIYAAPGNGGMAQIAECCPVKATDLEGMVALAKEKQVDLVFVAPDDPLAMGLVDRLEEAGIPAFGPNAAAARIEASKSFAKDLMKKYRIPTADYEVFEDKEKALAYLREKNAYPTVIKADGLALGKGVIIAQNYEQAAEAVTDMLEGGRFGTSGKRVVIEEFLTGIEASVLAFTDGKCVRPMVSAQDHKRVFDNDQGPNTGGMGAFSPSLAYTDELAELCMDTIYLPTVRAMAAEGCPFKGVLYFGLMLTPNGPKVIEYNCRFGDPETQVVLPRLQSDLVPILLAVCNGTLEQADIRWDPRHAVCVVAASGGYPGSYETGFPIAGLERAEALGCTVYHAGTKAENGQILTAGGRVLAVSALGDSHQQAVEQAYKGLAEISFEKLHARSDIGKRTV
ncbi:MAG: phosphoribosylamine--glycine ligase [Clostridia bacterium]|nr:phosphoribosylamine--glycine ligase [Clostridia bacterium]